MHLSDRSRLTISVLTGLFVLLAFVGGPSNEFELRLLADLAQWRRGNSPIESGAIYLTQLGSIWMTLLLPLALAFLLILLGHRRTGATLGAFAIFARLMQEGAKILIDRPRPPEEGWAVLVHSLSFPSGHSMNSLVMWTALALFLAPTCYRKTTIAIAAIFGLSIGLTRPLLGVHYPSDVLGGWALGTILLLMAHGAGLFERRLR